MLTKFRVKNFKNFEESLEFDLASSSYQFNDRAVKSGIVKNAVIYGNNASGKSNLIYALMDITNHLTDYTKQENHYNLYLNLDSESDYAEFEYEFKFSSHKLEYSYKKYSMNQIFDEQITIDGEVVVCEKLSKNYRNINLSGAETLNFDERPLNLSFVKYIFSNSKLNEEDANVRILLEFRNFVNGMLFFGSGTSERNFYHGFKIGQDSIQAAIIERNKLSDLQNLLNEMGVSYNLEAGEDMEDNKVIIACFNNKKVPLYSVASHGTKVIIAFFYWLMDLENMTMLLVDEFDAYYHNTVSEKITKIIRDSQVQSLFTTHNTTIMSNDILRPDCYYVLQNNQIKSLPELTKKELRFAHNLEKMYNAGAFDE